MSPIRWLGEEFEYLRELGFGDDDYRWLGRDELDGVLRVDRALAGIHIQPGK